MITFNQRVVGSIPTGLTIKINGLRTIALLPKPLCGQWVAHFHWVVTNCLRPSSALRRDSSAIGAS